MHFGWLTLAHSPTPEDDYLCIEQQLTQACYAEQLGFDDVWLTEHNFTGESVFCDPIPFASTLAARTSRVRIGFAVIQMALRHPIRDRRIWRLSSGGAVLVFTQVAVTGFIVLFLVERDHVDGRATVDRREWQGTGQ